MIRAAPGKSCASTISSRDCSQIGRICKNRARNSWRTRSWPEGNDELAEMAQAEIPGLETRLTELERAVQYALLPPDPNEDRDAILEIRAGTGGDEAALFAADLYRMYTRYAEIAGLKIEPMESSPSELGGFREMIFRVSGEGVFRKLRYESGVHRVQRVPATEAQGRIHTSTATVAVLPEAEEVDLELKPDEIRIEVCRAGGPGGSQGASIPTDSPAVQVMHIPSGMIVRCQDGRSQQKNKEKALQILRSRLLEKKQREEAEKYAAHRKSQIGTGDRSEKVRTYNFKENRVTDHRVGVTLYNLDGFMAGGHPARNDLTRLCRTADMERPPRAAANLSGARYGLTGVCEPERPAESASAAQRPFLMKTVLEVITATTAYFEKHGVENARLSIEHLLAPRAGQSSGWISTCSLTARSRRQRAGAAPRTRPPAQPRANRSSISSGPSSSSGHTFSATKRALIPRPETEELCEKLLAERTWGKPGSIRRRECSMSAPATRSDRAHARGGMAGRSDRWKPSIFRKLRRWQLAWPGKCRPHRLGLAGTRDDSTRAILLRQPRSKAEPST